MIKQSILIWMVLFLASAGFSQHTFIKVEPDQIPENNIKTAQDLAGKLLNGQKTGNIYMLTDQEATPEMVKGLTEAMQVASYESIKQLYGDFISLEFVETWTLQISEQYFVYRFKGNFSETKDTPEVRVVMNESGKISGFWLRPWKDDMESDL